MLSDRPCAVRPRFVEERIVVRSLACAPRVPPLLPPFPWPWQAPPLSRPSSVRQCSIRCKDGADSCPPDPEVLLSLDGLQGGVQICTALYTHLPPLRISGGPLAQHAGAMTRSFNRCFGMIGAYSKCSISKDLGLCSPICPQYLHRAVKIICHPAWTTNHDDTAEVNRTKKRGKTLPAGWHRVPSPWVLFVG